MKRLKYAVILLLGLSMVTTMMTSCKKDNSQLIVGKWVSQNEKIKTHFSGDEDWFWIYPETVFIFTAEGLTTFPYEVLSFSYEVNGNQLIIRNNVYNIDELTTSTLKLSNTAYPDDAQIILSKTN